MRLSADVLQQVARGCVSVRQEPDGIIFDRMTAQLHEHYSQTEAQIVRAACPAGVRLRFQSDTTFIHLALRYGEPCRPFYGTDVFADEAFVGTFGPRNPADQWEADIFSVSGRKMRTFDIWLPYAVESQIIAMEIDDDAQVDPLPRAPMTWLAIGDSITQGMTASSPSRTYVAEATRSLNMEVHNTGVGGATMEATAGSGVMPIEFGFATVAFGVNDWNTEKPLEKFRADTKALLEGVLKKRATLPIGLITPPPSDDLHQMEKKAQSLEAYRRVLREAALSFPTVQVIEGPSLMLAEMDRFVDGIHPNDLGMTEMGRNLTAALEPMIKTAKNT